MGPHCFTFAAAGYSATSGHTCTRLYSGLGLLRACFRRIKFPDSVALPHQGRSRKDPASRLPLPLVGCTAGPTRDFRLHFPVRQKFPTFQNLLLVKCLYRPFANVFFNCLFVTEPWEVLKKYTLWMCICCEVDVCDCLTLWLVFALYLRCCGDRMSSFQ